MIDRLVLAVRRAVERMLPWYDPIERDRRARRTAELHQEAIDARIGREHDLASYHRVRLPR